MGCFSCFDGGNKQRRREEERLASEARAKAAEAAQKRQFLLSLSLSLTSFGFAMVALPIKFVGLGFIQYNYALIRCFLFLINLVLENYATLTNHQT